MDMSSKTTTRGEEEVKELGGGILGSHSPTSPTPQHCHAIVAKDHTFHRHHCTLSLTFHLSSPHLLHDLSDVHCPNRRKKGHIWDSVSFRITKSKLTKLLSITNPLPLFHGQHTPQKALLRDSFSFPSTPTPDSDFEFGSLTPDSPSTEPFTASPADHLFLNGRLQPHPFPLPTSRTSSTKDSLLSSRSNSTNSSCSSARTSSSDSSERRSFHNKLKGGSLRSKTLSHYQAYGYSQRWQYITPVPALNREGSVRRTRDAQQGKKDKGTKRKHNDKKKNKQSKKEMGNKGVRLRFGRRILRWFVMACRECHAMEPSKDRDKEM
ncbi:hypothetical protein E2542_SST09365 [Spatholobus suberectus]|nr:hypothetical protein E2542_SST09365 [Spatholobus suberectus]